MAFLFASSGSLIASRPRLRSRPRPLVCGLVIEKVVACGAILSIKHFAGMQPPSNSFFSILTRASPWVAPDFLLLARNELVVSVFA